MSTAARAHAAAALEISADATAKEATSAFLAGLTKTNFVPPANSIAALNTLAGLAIPVSADTSPTLREEVEEFAERYWTLAPTDRLAVWLALSTRGPNDETAERLVALQAGLEIPGTPLPNPAEEQIAAIARLLYLMSPRERAIHRNVWLLSNAVRHTELVEAADAIRQNHASLVSLDPDLFERLGPGFNSGLFADTATTSPLTEKAYASPRPIVYPPPKLIRPLPKASKKSLSAAHVIAMCIGLMLLNAAFNLGSNSGPRYGHDPYKTPRQLPSHHEREAERGLKEIDTFGQTLQSRSLIVFSQPQVDAFEAYEKDKSRSMPPYYADWVLANRPKANEPYLQPQSRPIPGASMSPPPEKGREK